MSIKSAVKKIIPNKIKMKIEDRVIKIVKKKLKNTECSYKIRIEDTKKFENKVALVTGGSGAIGSAICFKLAMEGAHVIIAGRNKENLKTVLEQIKNNNGKAEIIELDVTDEKEIKNKVEQIIKKFGKIDILINNAGGSARKKNKELVNQDIDIIDMVINSNLRGTLLCTKFVSKYMIEKKEGKIVNISSTIGVQGQFRDVDYSAAKAGIIGATKSMAKELGKYNINVNCVSPGRVNQILFDLPLGDIPDDGCYLGRRGSTDDIANLVEFLVSEESSFITGQNIIIDGGRTLALKND